MENIQVQLGHAILSVQAYIDKISVRRSVSRTDSMLRTDGHGRVRMMTWRTSFLDVRSVFVEGIMGLYLWESLQVELEQKTLDESILSDDYAVRPFYYGHSRPSHSAVLHFEGTIGALYPLKTIYMLTQHTAQEEVHEKDREIRKLTQKVAQLKSKVCFLLRIHCIRVTKLSNLTDCCPTCTSRNSYRGGCHVGI